MKKLWIGTVLIVFFSICSGFTSRKDTDEFMIFLKVKVLDELGNPVYGAQVDLYETRSDYENQQHMLSSDFTNKHGKAKFKKHLHKKQYFVHVQKDGKTNEHGQVKTDQLHNVSFNQETVVIY